MFLRELVINKIFLTVLIAGFLAQFSKVLIYWMRSRKASWHDLVVMGGMPSFHSAVVVSLATIIYLTEGMTTAFLISLVLMVIVIVDALGVRRTAGEEGQLLTKMVKKFHLRTKIHYTLGHTPLQVLIGCVLGFVVALIMGGV